LLAFGEVRRGSLGIETQALNDELRELLGITTPRGVVVTRVRSESPAGKADVQVGDVLTALDGKPLLDPQSLHNIEGLLPVERPITVDIVRNGIAQQLQVVLTARARALEGGDLDPRLRGAAFAELPERVRRQGGNGVLVERVDAQSRAATNGLQAGDWITGLNRYAVDDLEALQQAAEQQPNRMVLSVVRGRRSGLVEMQ
jgi:S1-C subfamily serine protease